MRKIEDLITICWILSVITGIGGLGIEDEKKRMIVIGLSVILAWILWFIAIRLS